MCFCLEKARTKGPCFLHWMLGCYRGRKEICQGYNISLLTEEVCLETVGTFQQLICCSENILSNLKHKHSISVGFARVLESNSSGCAAVLQHQIRLEALPDPGPPLSHCCPWGADIIRLIFFAHLKLNLREYNTAETICSSEASMPAYSAVFLVSQPPYDGIVLAKKRMF